MGQFGSDKVKKPIEHLGFRCSGVGENHCSNGISLPIGSLHSVGQLNELVSLTGWSVHLAEESSERKLNLLFCPDCAAEIYGSMLEGEEITALDEATLSVPDELAPSPD
jgi:hypothetical protein